MPGGVHLSVAGLTVRIACDGVDQAIEHAWQRCLGSAADPDILVTAGLRGSAARFDVTATEPAELLSILSSVVTLRVIEALAGTRLLLHACGAAAADGGVIAFVGGSGAGKTTLAQALGAGYVSDELVIVGFDGAVEAYPKPLSVGAPGRVKAQVAPGDAGLKVAPPGLRLAGLVLIERSDAAPERPEIVELDLLEGIARLTPQTSALTRMPRPLHSVAAIVESAGGIRAVRYREAADLVPLLDLVRGDRG